MKEKNKAHNLSGPTKAQLEILQVLWNSGPATVRFVNDQLNSQKEATSYTSTLKLMQIMHEKQMLTRDETSMTHIYSTTLKEQTIKQHELKKFVDTMYNGSAKNLMMELLGHAKTTKKEWQTIQELLNKMENDK
ncbi:MAG TPA: BlaI/MecI/CopY family transcriptional regulator [Chitinophagaceae bacterium]|jgi:BlaI family transcriptional regulator, penicillinase repressor|nr:BlaI/MecI/CopY family transcriptional regulator [Chitinophagaceae bacterium]